MSILKKELFKEGSFFYAQIQGGTVGTTGTSEKVTTVSPCNIEKNIKK
jgi:hypothetical protein